MEEEVGSVPIMPQASPATSRMGAGVRVEVALPRPSNRSYLLNRGADPLEKRLPIHPRSKHLTCQR